MRMLASKLFFLVFSLIVMAGAAVIFPGHTVDNATAAGSHEQAVLLGYTVRVRMYTPMPEDQLPADFHGEPQFNRKRGLGTLLRVGHRNYVVTHNHWQVDRDILSHVELLTIDEKTIDVVTGETFLRLLRYEDDGTLIFLAPPRMQWLPAAELSAEPVVSGTQLLTIHRNPDTNDLKVIALNVDGDVSHGAVPAWRMRSTDNEVIAEGNSGAGVFLNGRLVGNVWMTIRYVHEVPGTHGAQTISLNSYLSDAAHFPAEATATMSH